METARTIRLEVKFFICVFDTPKISILYAYKLYCVLQLTKCQAQ